MRLDHPSLSRSPAASFTAGLRPLAVSHASGMPSPSVSVWAATTLKEPDTPVCDCPSSAVSRTPVAAGDTLRNPVNAPAAKVIVAGETLTKPPRFHGTVRPGLETPHETAFSAKIQSSAEFRSAVPMRCHELALLTALDPAGAPAPVHCPAAVTVLLFDVKLIAAMSAAGQPHATKSLTVESASQSMTQPRLRATVHEMPPP